MSTNPLQLSAPWRTLYLAALFEADRKRLPVRISEAEKALMVRERELYSRPRPTAEREAVNNALNALRALRNCHGLNHR